MSAKRVLGYCPVGHSRSPFDLLFDEVVDLRDVMVEGKIPVGSVDAVIFWGGTDIHPAIYGQKHHPTSQASRHGLSQRDAFELTVAAQCKAMGIPMIGVCRGAQLLCALAGGTLVQHCNGHSGDHEIQVEVFPNVFERVITTSSHHQMMNPRGSVHKVVASAYGPGNRAQYYEGETREDDLSGEMAELDDPEIVYFPEYKALAIQGHPEWVKNDDPFAVVCNKLVRQYLLEEKKYPKVGETEPRVEA